MNNTASIISNSLFLTFVVGIPLYGAIKRVAIFDAFVDGAKTGFTTIIKIIPYLVGLMVAIGMLRASGFFEVMGRWLSPALNKIGMPPEVLPLALVRPFSGSASNGIMADLMHTYGGNSFIAKLSATMMGSTETTFYVIAVYFGSVGIKKTRYAIPAGLIADAVGVIAAVIVCRYLFLL